jgi:hypothetical protein
VGVLIVAEQTRRERAIDDLWDALGPPGLFRRLVDDLAPSPIVTALKLWGIRHGVYPGDAIPVPELDELGEWLERRDHHPPTV